MDCFLNVLKDIIHRTRNILNRLKMASKIKVPADFGIENLDNPGTCNVILYLQGGQQLRVNSAILSYNGTEFSRLFRDLQLTSLQVDDFQALAVRTFAEAMYSGTIDLERPLFREIHKISCCFGVNWIIIKCDEFFENFCSTLMTSGTYHDFQFAVEEALYSKEVVKRNCLTTILVANSSLLDASRREEFLSKYLKKYWELPEKQLDLLAQIDKAAGLAADPVVARALVSQLCRPDAVMDGKSMFLLRSIGIENYCIAENEAKRAMFQSIFDIINRIDGCSAEDLRHFLHLHQRAFNLYVDGVEATLGNFLAVPNLFCSWKPFCTTTFPLLIEELLSSPTVCSLYMFIEGLVIGFLNRPYGFDDARIKDFVDKTSSTVDQRHWTKVPSNFLKTLPFGNNDLKKLVEILMRSDSLVDKSSVLHNVICRVVSDESPNMWNFLTVARTYTFHSESVDVKQKESSVTSATGPKFVVVVSPVIEDDDNSFDIRLQFQGHPHVYLPREGIPVPGSLHLVLEEWFSDASVALPQEHRWMNIGLLSWYGKPQLVRKNTYVEFFGRGFFNPSYRAKKSGPVRLVAYYNLPFEKNGHFLQKPKGSVESEAKITECSPTERLDKQEQDQDC